jgi:hypothetical protein
MNYELEGAAESQKKLIFSSFYYLLFNKNAQHFMILFKLEENAYFIF